MRLLRVLLVFAVLGGLAWTATRAVRVESTDDQVRITIDRQKLRQAGSDLQSNGRRAVSKVGQALEHVGNSIDGDEGRQNKSPAGAIFSR